MDWLSHRALDYESKLLNEQPNQLLNLIINQLMNQWMEISQLMNYLSYRTGWSISSSMSVLMNLLIA